jgi:hypothetical protein
MYRNDLPEDSSVYCDPNSVKLHSTCDAKAKSISFQLFLLTLVLFLLKGTMSKDEYFF